MGSITIDADFIREEIESGKTKHDPFWVKQTLEDHHLEEAIDAVYSDIDNPIHAALDRLTVDVVSKALIIAYREEKGAPAGVTAGKRRTVPATELEGLVEDPSTGIFSLIGHSGGTSLITGEIRESSLVPGSLRVETEHGVVHIDAEGYVDLLESSR